MSQDAAACTSDCATSCLSSLRSGQRIAGRKPGADGARRQGAGLSGEPSGTRTRDPLIKSPTHDECNDRDEHAQTGTCDGADDHEGRVTTDASGHVGTNLEPDPRAPVRLTVRRDARAEPSQRPESRRITYRLIRPYIYARHGFSPRTGWIAHVKELSGLMLRPTHNRRDPTRADPCPPRRRAAIEEALRHFGFCEGPCPEE